MGDTTLDSFLPEDDADAAEGNAAGEADTDADTDTETEEGSGTAPAVEPAVSTVAWTPDGTPCDACGTVVEWRWRDAGRVVCDDCKEW